MSYKDLKSFISLLEDKNELIRIVKPVCKEYEITEICQRLIKNSGPAVLFENVTDKDGKKCSMPVLANLFGKKERVKLAFGRKAPSLSDIGEMLAYLRQPEPPKGLKDAFDKMPLIKKALSLKPKIISKAKCQEVVIKGDEVDLDKLPIQFCWPKEPAPLITWPLVITKGPDPENDKTDEANIGIYRMQVLGKNKTCMRWLAHRGGAQHFAKWQKKNPDQPFPIAVAIGSDPAMILSAVTPVPDNMSEYAFAGLLRGEKTELVECKTVPLQVPANAEIVLEGHILPNETALEGPYGDHTGYFNAKEEFPVFEISAITMKKDPIYLTTHTGRPPDEPSVLGEALNELFTPLIRQQFPEIVDFYLPPEACSYRMAIVSIKKTYPGQAKRIMMGVWSFLRQFTYTKFVIIVDEDINVRDWNDVIWAISTCMDPVRDTSLIENTPIDYLDFASPRTGLGGKMGLDATTKIGVEKDGRDWGEKLKMEEEIINKVDNIWKELGLEKKNDN